MASVFKLGEDSDGVMTSSAVMIPKVEKVVLERDAVERSVDIGSQPVGDLMHIWAVALVRPDEPDLDTIVKLARGEWRQPYKSLWFSISISSPPVNMRLSIRSPLRGIKRHYLYATDFMPPVMNHEFFDDVFKATLQNYYHQLRVATLPGDEVFITLYSKQTFRGSLKILNYM
jgi:hypothetical protein